mgnify:CR=1 FL=1
MKPVKYLYFFLMAILVFTSCEKVIEVDVKDADKKYVIEGIVTNEAGGCLVKISQTKKLSDVNTFEGISGAQVRITDEKGVVSLLAETGQGIYQSQLVGVPGTKYHLQVTIGGEVYTAQSQMPQPVTLDSLYISDMDMLGEKQYATNIEYTDPSEKGNAYRFVQYINEKKEKDIHVQNDELTNGRRNTATLFSGDDNLQSGDVVMVELQSIDPVVYKYFYSLSRGGTGGNSTTPANPASNLSGGALGYFSAHTIASKRVTVK